MSPTKTEIKMSELRPIDERTDFLQAVVFSDEQRDEIDRIMEWLADFPDEAAGYIVWLEKLLDDD